MGLAFKVRAALNELVKVQHGEHVLTRHKLEAIKPTLYGELKNSLPSLRQSSERLKLKAERSAKREIGSRNQPELDIKAKAHKAERAAKRGTKEEKAKKEQAERQE